VAYTTAEARQQLLDSLAGAIDQLGRALASLTEAYEQLDDYAAERLEQQLFGPVQLAYGRARRTHAEFAQRHGLPARSFESQAWHGRPGDARGAIEAAGEAATAADDTLSTLQDSMLPVEVGDPPLRAGLAEVRSLVSDVSQQAHELLRTLGR
jgi:hypothetical protein